MEAYAEFDLDLVREGAADGDMTVNSYPITLDIICLVTASITLTCLC